MKVHDLRKLIEAVPYDFDIHVSAVVRPTKYTAEAKTVYIDFENKLLVIGEIK